MTVSSRVVAHPQPQHEISDLAPLRAVPPDVDRRKKPEPTQQVEPVGTLGRLLLEVEHVLQDGLVALQPGEPVLAGLLGYLLPELADALRCGLDLGGHIGGRHAGAQAAKGTGAEWATTLATTHANFVRSTSEVVLGAMRQQLKAGG